MGENWSDSQSQFRVGLRLIRAHGDIPQCQEKKTVKVERKKGTKLGLEVAAEAKAGRIRCSMLIASGELA